MEKIYCDISALRFYRTPPRYFYALPPICDFDTPYGRRQLRSDLVATCVLGIPIHALSQNNERFCSTLVRQHLWTKGVPSQGVIDTPFDVSVTSPLLTLLMLACRLDPIETALLIYEFSGTFSIFKPSEGLEEQIAACRQLAHFDALDDWERVIGTDGTATNLWRRPALIDLEDIQGFLARHSGMRGSARLAQAMRYVTGSTASPFEAKASMLLGAPRRLGGMGLSGLRNNVRIELDADARRICGKRIVYGDIVWEATGKHPAVILECQGGVAHIGSAAAQYDDDRALALESMGFTVVRATYKQIQDEARFDLLAHHLAGLLGTQIRPAAPLTASHQRHMREVLFGPWPCS